MAIKSTQRSTSTRPHVSYKVAHDETVSCRAWSLDVGYFQGSLELTFGIDIMRTDIRPGCPWEALQLHGANMRVKVCFGGDSDQVDQVDM